MELSDLKSLAQLGEDSSRQFKVDIKNATSLAAEMAAFSNGEGGDIYIGVSDNGDLTGLNNSDVGRINQLISNTASQHVKSPLNVLTENVALNNGRIVIVLTVPKGIDKPYFDKNGVIWLKCGADKRRINSKEELRRLFQSVNQFHADELPTNAGIEKLDKLRFRDFLRDIYQLDYPESREELLILLQNLNLVSENGMLNLAGVLLFSENPEWIKPQFVIKAIRYPGKRIHASEFLDSEDFSGPLQKMFKDSKAFIMRNLHKIQAGQGINHPGIPEIPESVFDELLVNALSHRDYLINAPIRLFIFDDRIEIISPGHLPNNLTVKKIMVGNTNIRNPILVSYIAKGILPYRGLGSGINRAIENWSTIDFKDDRDGDMFSAIVFRKETYESEYDFKKPSSEEVRNNYWNDTGIVQDHFKTYSKRVRKNIAVEEIIPENGSEINRKDLQKSSEIIIDRLKQNPRTTIAILATDLGISTRAIEKQLANLKRAKRIRRIGSNKSGFWEVKK